MDSEGCTDVAHDTINFVFCLYRTGHNVGSVVLHTACHRQSAVGGISTAHTCFLAMNAIASEYEVQFQRTSYMYLSRQVFETRLRRTTLFFTYLEVTRTLWIERTFSHHDSIGFPKDTSARAFEDYHFYQWRDLATLDVKILYGA